MQTSPIPYRSYVATGTYWATQHFVGAASSPAEHQVAAKKHHIIVVVVAFIDILDQAKTEETTGGTCTLSRHETQRSPRSAQPFEQLSKGKLSLS